ncbi:hypothetical protein ABPG73_022586 [Tetrahymena malaccensis]
MDITNKRFNDFIQYILKIKMNEKTKSRSREEYIFYYLDCQDYILSNFIYILFLCICSSQIYYILILMIFLDTRKLKGVNISNPRTQIFQNEVLSIKQALIFANKLNKNPKIFSTYTSYLQIGMQQSSKDKTTEQKVNVIISSQLSFEQTQATDIANSSKQQMLLCHKFLFERKSYITKRSSYSWKVLINTKAQQYNLNTSERQQSSFGFNSKIIDLIKQNKNPTKTQEFIDRKKYKKANSNICLL